MFLLPFVLAGFVMLSVLNPRYTTELINQAIPHTQLLGRALSHAAGFIARSPELHYVSRLIHYTLDVSAPLGASDASLVAQLPLRTNDTRGLGGSSGITLRTLPRDDAHFSGMFSEPPSDSESLELLLLFLMLCLLWGVCSSLVDQFRLPEPLSAAASAVEDLVAQSSPKAFTPSSSPELGGLSVEQSENTSSPIPTKLHFVNPGGNELFGGSTFILNTRAALDAILAIPTRVFPVSSESTGSLAELDEQPTISPNGSPFCKPSAPSDAQAAQTAQGMHRLMAQSGTIPPWRQRQRSPQVTDASPAGASPISRSPMKPRAEDAEAAPRARARTQQPSSLLGDAVMFTVAKSANASASNVSYARTISSAVQNEFPNAFIEEVPESPWLPLGSGDAETAGKYRIPQRQPRPKHPPVTVWPRIPLEARRSRMPSVQPVRMTASSATAWEQPRRSRTTSGM
ncbi:hypothetical protein OH77DRAFT_1389690 [Trametes cingulata]|nr:hypothetical protein OH77DRAFT_1389690 [Trametes cingulata]